jgi:hypothetical protein
MIVFRFSTISSFIFIFLLFSCNTKENSNQEKKLVPPINLQDNPTNKINTKSTKVEESSENNPLLQSKSFKNISTFLPSDINGVKGGDFEGWTKELQGSKYTLVKRAYRDQKNKTRIDISIADAGTQTLKSVGLGNYWLNKKIDSQSDKGYEKTSSFISFPAFEKCQNSSCDFYFAIGERFLIGGYSENIELDELLKVLKTIDVDKLQKLPK